MNSAAAGVLVVRKRFPDAAPRSLMAVLAMDIHKKFSKAVVMSADCEILWEKKASHPDKREMTKFFSRFEPGTDVVMEAA